MIHAEILDLETSLHNKGDDAVGDFLSNPHSPHNWIVWLGRGSVNFEDPEEANNLSRVRFPHKGAVNIHAPQPGTLIVGHNLKYDLSMLAAENNKSAREWFEWITNPDSMIWDTQVAAYRLSGQTKIMPSLNSEAAERGWPLKPNRMKEYWDAGISTEDIPDEEVRPYLAHDVNTTGRLFVDQLAQAQANGMLDLLREEMGSTLSLTAAEVNGMYFDKRNAMTEYEGRLQEAIVKAQSAAELALVQAGVPESAVNVGSTKLLNVLVYGGEYKYEETRPMLDETGEPVLFKSGQRKGLPRTKKHTLVYESKRKTQAPTEKVDEDDLLKIKGHPSTEPAVKDSIDSILKFRELKKEASTYFLGYSQLTWPHDSMIHGELNQSVVATGRLSSSKPNLQNAAHGPVRKNFKSRKKGGRLMEADLTQIEIVVQGILSGDERMLADLHAGVDFHSKRAALAWANGDYDLVRQAYLDEDIHWSKKRKDAKIFSFQRAYGAGPAKIAGYTGMSFKEVQDLIAAEEREYPGLKEMTDEWEKQVIKSATRVGDDVLGKLTSATGARYVFTREMYKGKASFRPTMIKNYPIQGLAGDILKIVLNRIRQVVWRWSIMHDVYFINTVHDSLIFDIGTLSDEQARQFGLEIHHVMTKVTQQVLLETFGLDFQGLIKADVEVGENWYRYHPEDNPEGMRALSLNEE